MGIATEKTVIVTGAAGFIGSHLCRTLLDRGYRVIGYDNLSHGFLRNLASCEGDPGWVFVRGDVMDRTALLRAARGGTAVIHLAAEKIPRYSDALDTLEVNAWGARNVLQVAVDLGLKVIMASTSDVYGKNPDVPFSETSASVIGDPTVKRWSYALSKLYEEQLTFAFRDRYRLPVTILRFFGGYGPHQHLTWWGGPQSVFIANALQGEPIEIHGDGLQTRTFTYVTDLVQGIVKALESPKAVGEVFNVGDTREITIRKLGEIVWRLVRDDEPRMTFIPYETFGKYEDVRRRVPDVRKAMTLLDFKPGAVSMEEGLSLAIAWQRRVMREEGLLPAEAIPTAR